MILNEYYFYISRKCIKFQICIFLNEFRYQIILKLKKNKDGIKKQNALKTANSYKKEKYIKEKIKGLKYPY